MDAIRSAFAAVGWLIAGTTLAQVSGLDGAYGDASGEAPAASHPLSREAPRVLLAEMSGQEEQPRRSAVPRTVLDYSQASYFSAYRETPIGGLVAAAGVQAVPVMASAAFIERQTGIDTRAMLSAERWLGADHGIARTFVVGHAWRDLTLEGAAFTSRDDSRLPGERETRKLDSRSARLSFSPATNWVMRLSRGSVTGLDSLVAGEEVRRTAISATYQRSYADGDWQTTFAWGRNSRKFRESTVGYLVESAFRFNGVHSLFGRVEQVGSDELARENESMQRQLFMMNKLTLGYSQDLHLTPALRMDTGVYVSRHFVPSSMALSYGSGPVAYMMFMRLKMQ